MTDFKEQAERLIANAETQDMAECIEALATAQESRDAASKLRPGAIITKIKVLKEGAGE